MFILQNLSTGLNTRWFTVVSLGTSVLSNLVKGRIAAVLSPLVAENAFVRRMRWAGTFARGGMRTVHSKALILRLPIGDLEPSFLDPPNGISIGFGCFAQA